jgi:hypothetical protein
MGAEWDLELVSQEAYKESRWNSWFFLPPALFVTAAGGVLGLLVLVEPSHRDPFHIFPAVFLLGAGGYLLRLLARYWEQGATKVRIDSEAVTFYYPRRPGHPRILRWDSPKFRLVMRKDQDPNMAGEPFCLNPPQGGWPQTQLQGEQFDAIVSAARSAEMSIEEKKTLWGWRTWITIGPRGSPRSSLITRSP